MKYTSIEDLKKKVSEKPYGIPSTYFSNLPVRISDRVNQKQVKPSVIFAPWIRLATVAASLVIVITLWFKPFENTNYLDTYSFENQLYWSLWASDISIQQFFFNEDFDHEVMDRMIMDEASSFAFEETFGYDPNWDF